MRQFFSLILIMTSVIVYGQNAQIVDLWKLYNSHEYKSAINQAKTFLEDEPNNIELNLIIGRSYTDSGDFKNAITFLESVVANDNHNSWRKAWALSYLGTCYFMHQDYEKSESSLNECIKLNATKNATNKAYSQTLLFGFHDFFKTWKIFETDNFRFHFQNMSAIEMEKYGLTHEKAFNKINDFFKSTIPKKIDFYVWESRKDAKRILRADLGFSRPSVCIVHLHYQQTIGHEMTHVISNYSTKINNKTGLINEGAAVYFDQDNYDKEKIVKERLKTNKKTITINKLWTNFRDYPDKFSYPLSGLFIKELIDNFGREKFLEFFSNQTYDNARLVFGEKLDKVIEDFENKINRKD